MKTLPAQPSLYQNTIAMGTTCNQEDYRWMCLLGSTMPLT